MPIISNRSGETDDDTMAHLAVGWQTPIIKIAIEGKERLAKTKKLINIEKEIEKIY
jgi:enolase